MKPESYFEFACELTTEHARLILPERAADLDEMIRRLSDEDLEALLAQQEPRL